MTEATTTTAARPSDRYFVARAVREANPVLVGEEHWALNDARRALRAAEAAHAAGPTISTANTLVAARAAERDARQALAWAVDQAKAKQDALVEAAHARYAEDA